MSAGVQGLERAGERERGVAARARARRFALLSRQHLSSHQPSSAEGTRLPISIAAPCPAPVFHAIRASSASASASVARTVAAPCAVASPRGVTCSRRHASAARRGAPPEVPHRHLTRSDTTRPERIAATRHSLRRVRLCCRGAPALCGTWWRWRARLQNRQTRSADGASAQRTRRLRAS